jgi:pimeloyl-ACP methyl ester carboxylesterase
MDPIPPPSAPSPLRTLREAAVGLEVLRLLAGLRGLGRHPRGAGEPVMVLPGFGAGDASTLVLRTHLRRLGYRVTGWGLGVNRGDVPRLMGEVARAVAERAGREGAPLRLVGWSLGGVLAREAARDVPEHVDRVITLGTPVVGGPRYTATARIYEARGEDLAAIEAAVEERERTPIRVPVTAVYSEQDGIVDWRACIDRWNPQVEHVRVRATHVGLGFSPQVLRLVAERLATPRSATRDG